MYGYYRIIFEQQHDKQQDVDDAIKHGSENKKQRESDNGIQFLLGHPVDSYMFTVLLI